MVEGVIGMNKCMLYFSSRNLLTINVTKESKVAKKYNFGKIA